MEKFPPQNYVEVPSKIPGFVIYAPVQEKEVEEKITEFKCPKCGAFTAYAIDQAGLACEHCGYQEQILADVVGKEAEKFDFSLENLTRASHGWGEERKDLRCMSCGAEINLPPESMATTCAFCGSNKVVQASANQDQLRPKYLIPFKIDPHKCQQIARNWLGESWMVPKELKNFAALDSFTAIYLPYWTFHAITDASWQAEVGHRVSEQYYDASSKSWKTRTKIVWRWESGNAGLQIDDLLIAGTERVSARHLGNVNEFDLSAIVAYAPVFLAGMQAKGYDRPLESAWENARGVMREKTKDACIRQASTSMVRNFSMKLDFSDESWRYLLLPVYLAAYQFTGKTYHAIVNGQTGDISGQRPVDWKKIWLVIAMILAPGLVTGLAGLLTMPSSDDGFTIAIIGFFLLVIGLIVSVVIFVKADKEGKL
jgi:DNA-directed RNA polymerase subunit RPC12/RpoP